MKVYEPPQPNMFDALDKTDKKFIQRKLQRLYYMVYEERKYQSTKFIIDFPFINLHRTKIIFLFEVLPYGVCRIKTYQLTSYVSNNTKKFLLNLFSCHVTLITKEEQQQRIKYLTANKDFIITHSYTKHLGGVLKRHGYG